MLKRRGLNRSKARGRASPTRIHRCRRRAGTPHRECLWEAPVPRLNLRRRPGASARSRSPAASQFAARAVNRGSRAGRAVQPDMARVQKVRRALNVLLRLQAAQGTAPPADMVDARDRLQKEATAAMQARQTRNPEQEEKSLEGTGRHRRRDREILGPVDAPD